MDLRLASTIHLQLCLPTQPADSRRRQILRLALRSTSNLRWLPTIPACLPTRLQLAPSLRLPANLPAHLQLAPSINLPVPPSNLTSDSHRPLIPSALPSSQPSACAADQPSSPAWRTNVRLRLLHLRLCFPVLSPTCVFNWPFRLAFELNLRFLGCCIPSALPSSRPAACATDQPSGPA